MLTGAGAIGGLESAAAGAGEALFGSVLVKVALGAEGAAAADFFEAGAAGTGAELVGAVDGVDGDAGTLPGAFAAGFEAVFAFGALMGTAFFAAACARTGSSAGADALFGAADFADAAAFAAIFFGGAGLLKRFSWPPIVAHFGDGE